MRRWRENPAAIIGIMLALLVAFFALAPASAQDLGGRVNEGLSFATIVGWGTQDLRVTIMRIIQILLGFLGLVALIIILWAGWQWMTSGGDPQKIQDAKRTLVNAVLGLLVIFSAFAIVSFIISSLSGAVGPQGGARRPPPALPCFNCDALGTGIIEAVYPAPGTRDVPRNTLMFVTFKLPIKPATMLNGSNIGDQITITALDPPLGEVARADVGGNGTGDNLTFTFTPRVYLGDGVRDVLYQVSLGCGIQRTDDVFAFVPCVGTGYAWTFTVGTRLDLTPPTLDVVFPQPDDTKDTYAPVTALQSAGGLTVERRPNTAQNPRVADLVPEGPAVAPNGFSSSAYNCSADNFVCLVWNSVTSQFVVNPKAINAAGCADPTADRGGWLPVAVEAGNSVALGCGISIGFDNITDAKVPGNPQWHFRAFGPRRADTLQVGQGPLYTFVDSVTAGTNIAVGTPESPLTVAAIAAEIVTALDAPVQTPDVSAKIDDVPPIDNTLVVLTAVVAGTAGDNIRITASGNWAQIDGFGGGADAGFAQTQLGGQLDVARNATPRLDFSETMFPLPISGPSLIVDDGVGDDGVANNNVGTLSPGPPPFVTVQADLDDDGFEPTEYVGGTYIISNLYHTVEFKSSSLCGQCHQARVSCTRSDECNALIAGDVCDPVRNSCGDQIFCLPTVQPAPGNLGGVTRYRMTVRAATLFQCNETPPDADPANDCQDSSFSACSAAPGICQSAGGVNYPRVGSVCVGTGVPCGNDAGCGGVPGSCLLANDGAMDAARNSLNGDGDAEAEGPSDPEHLLNNPPLHNGDSVQWTFWVNNQLELTPPKIKLAADTPLPAGADDGIFPNFNDSGMPVTTVPSAAFTKVLSSSSLRSDNHYRNGRCGCVPGAMPSDCRSGEECDTDSLTCRSTSGLDNLCLESTDCLDVNLGCKTRWHVTLNDNACTAAGRCTSWWVQNRGYDTDATPDGFPNYSEVLIQHTPMAEFSRYGVDMGSGIQDLYQNCYLPSEGPGTAAGGACGTNRANPYCCDGVPRATPCTP